MKRNRKRSAEVCACKKKTALSGRTISRFFSKDPVLFLFLFSVFSIPTVQAGANRNPARKTVLSAKIYYFENKLKDSSLNIKEKENCYDSLACLYRRAGKEQERYRSLKEKISLLKYKGDYQAAMQICRDILDEKQDLREWTRQDSIEYVESKLNLGSLSITTGLYEEGASNLMDLLNFPAPDWIKLRAYSYLGYMYMRNQRYAESMKYHRMALSIFSRMPEGEIRESQKNLLFNHLAGTYYAEKKYDSAIHFLKIAVEALPEHSSQRLFAFHNMSLIYLEIGETEMAKEYLKKTIETAKTEDDLYIQAVAMQNLGFIYAEEGRLKEAENLYLEAMEIARYLNANDVLSGMMIDYADLLFQMGKYKEFKMFYQAGTAKRDSVSGALNQEKMDLLNYKHESYRIASEKKILEQHLELTSLANQKKTIILIGLGLLIVILTAYMIYMVRKIKSQARENFFIHNQIETIRQKMQKQEEDSLHHLETSLESKNRELASRALYLVRVNEVLKQVSNGLGEIKECENRQEREQLIDSLQKDVRNFDGTVNGWKDFRLYFEQIHKDFYRQLTQAAPDLSPVEQRLCALLASNLTTKEIAEITDRSVRTIETMIYRIRKKLRLTSEVKIPLYLQKFLR